MADHVLIVGAGQGGTQLALSLRQSGHGGRITLVGDEPGLPYQRPPLSKTYLKDGKEERLHLRSASIFEEQRIDLVCGRRVADIGRATRQAVFEDGARMAWDRLVLATGTRVCRPPIAGLDLPAVFALRTLADARRIRAALPGFGRVVIIGGGFIGLEFAAVAAAAGCAVHIVEGASRIMARAVSPKMSALFQAAHEAAGARFSLNTLVTAIEAGNPQSAPDGSVTVRLSDGRALAADGVVLAAGVVPNTELAEQAGLEVDNGIRVDAFLTTADPVIHAIGDCSCFPDPGIGRHIRLESVQAAADHGRCLAGNLAGATAAYNALPWFWSDQGSLKLQIAGLSTLDDAEMHRATTSGGDVVFRMRGDHIVAVETLNAAAEHMAARKLLAKGPLPVGSAERHGFDLRACLAEQKS